MLGSALIVLALSSAAASAAPATTYKPCTITENFWKEKYGRTRFGSTNSWLFSNELKVVNDQGALVSQTTALLNRDEKTWAPTPGVGMVLVPATSKSLGPLKLAISYESDDDDDVAYVETLQGEACVVPDSGDWKTVHAILNADEKGRPLLECEEAVVSKTERYTNPKTEPYFTEEDDNDFNSSNSVSTDPKNKMPAISLHMDRHLGVFITQDPAYQTKSKIAIKHRNFKGDSTTRVVYANKTPIKLPQGDPNAAVYNTGFCVVSGFETWTDIESVDFVVAA